MKRPATRCRNSIQITLLQHYIFSYDQPMSGHLFERWKNAVHMLIRVNEDDDDRQLAAGIDEVGSFHPMATEKSRDRMDGRRAVYVLFPQVVEDFDVKRAMMPLVRFVEIDGDLNCHSVWHFTAPSPEPCPPARQADKAHYWSGYWPT